MGTDSTRGLARLLRLARGVALAPADEERYQHERGERNRRAIRAAIAILIPFHLLGAVLFWPAGGPIAQLGDFDATLCLVNIVVIPIVLGLVGLALYVEPGRPLGRWRSWATDLYALAYVLFGVALSVNAQRKNGNINLFTIAILGNTLLLRQQAWAMVTNNLVGLVALIVGVVTLQPERELRMMAVTPALTVVMIGVVLSRINVSAARAEVAARLTIERQRAELAASHDQLAELNRDLERRVREHVDEIVSRATEIEKLNRHLSAQVIDRSRHLARAFKALGPGRPVTLDVGSTLDGRVEIRGHLGAGAWGDVYLGHDRILERDVAVKVLRLDAGVARDTWVRFAAEAGAAASIRHPGVVHTFHVGVTEDGRLYQLQDLVDGVTLAATLERGGGWPAHAVARIGGQLADALAAAHAAGIVHRDVKPSNVMLTPASPGVRLPDFGVSRTLTPGAGGSTGNDMVGTPLYMAPEQIAAPDTVGAPCDVYALGVVLHELCAGAPPFVGGTAKLLHAHLERPAPRLDEALAPAALADLIVACLAKEPAARPTARALADALTALADAGGAPAAEALRPPAIDPARGGAAATLRQDAL